mmetsp:Transcript_66118/g.213803  ORF Transcript_66118/g.213803 Transcript_66118/m.213803 type:complete len:94 (+) Transcript_66118:66-347(+)
MDKEFTEVNIEEEPLRPRRIRAGIWPAMHEVAVATVVAKSLDDTPDGWGIPVWGRPRDHEARRPPGLRSATPPRSRSRTRWMSRSGQDQGTER